eukprot:scaffold125793_cov19-Tisochrysis_lutea.AAC.1
MAMFLQGKWHVHKDTSQALIMNNVSIHSFQMTTQACNNRLKPLTNAYNHGRSLGHALPRSSMIKAAHSRTPNALISLHGACSIKAYVMLERTRLAKQVFSHAHNPSASQATFLTTAHKLCFQRLHVLHIHTITVAPGCVMLMHAWK